MQPNLTFTKITKNYENYEKLRKLRKIRNYEEQWALSYQTSKNKICKKIKNNTYCFTCYENCENYVKYKKYES